MGKNAKIKFFSTKLEARDAFLKDLSDHRDCIEKAFNLYGTAFCREAKVDIDDIKQRIEKHDLSLCENGDETIGFIVKFYQFPMKDLPINSNRRNIMYSKSLYKHYRNNDYYVEHWVSYNNGSFIATEMSKESVVEMVLDWIALGYDQFYLPPDIYWNTRQNRKLVHKNTVELINKLIAIYKDIK